MASYGEVARILGLTESRITQVTALLGLAPAVQERVLLGEGGVGIREAIRAAREVVWERQRPSSTPLNRPRAPSLSMSRPWTLSNRSDGAAGRPAGRADVLDPGVRPDQEPDPAVLGFRGFFLDDLC